MTNIAKLLKDVPKGMKLYSPLFGEVEYMQLGDENKVWVKTSCDTYCFDKYGKPYAFDKAECLLFPSKDCRTWEGWKLPVKPKFKFKVGDWIVKKDGNTFYGGNYAEQITLVEVDEKGKYIWLPSKTWVDADYIRLWTIADAKDGDVLVSRSDNPFIYNGNIEFSSAGAYIGVSRDGKIRLDMFPSKAWTSIKDVKPATNEQRVLLFKKIQEAGYQWYAGKKELKKIQPHYDISNFHEGMPVLVREYDTCVWQWVLYSHFNGVGLFFAAGKTWRQCIPFNEDTKHLLGTMDMCPEEYVNW